MRNALHEHDCHSGRSMTLSESYRHGHITHRARFIGYHDEVRTEAYIIGKGKIRSRVRQQQTSIKNSFSKTYPKLLNVVLKWGVLNQKHHFVQSLPPKQPFKPSHHPYSTSAVTHR